MAIIKGLKKNLSSIGLKTKELAFEKAQIQRPIINVKTKKDPTTGERIDPKQLGNLYTGKRLNPLYAAAATGVYLAGNNSKNSVQHHTTRPLELATMRDFQDYGAPDVMMYDGVGQERAPKNMNADGSIVFGLHNMRRG